MRYLQSIAWFAAFACLSLGFGWMVGTASQHHPDVVKIEANRQSDRGQQAEATENPRLLVQLTAGAEKSDEEVSEYWTIFGHRLKLTDTLLGVFTFLLIPVGLIQAYILRRSVQHMRISERAHVSGGANSGTTPDGRRVLVIAVNNYGKTEATIGTVAATICEEGELDAFPGWKVNDWAGHVFVKNWKGYVFWQTSGQRIDVVLPFQSGKVIAGRIWYRDIFKKQYSVGFLLKTDDLTAIGRRSFWEEREEKDPNE
jgi:hypothetical protein